MTHASWKGVLALAAPCMALAQAPAPASAPTPVPTPAPVTTPGQAVEGPEELGARLAREGLPPQGVAACSSCHGARGEGQAAAGFPRIAGQSATYLLRQLESYASGTRSHPVMTPIAQALKPEQAAAVSSFYARLGFPGAPPARAPARAGQAAPVPADGAAPDAARGQLLAQRGDERLQLQACANCHGPAGAGQPPVYPYLAGQHASYLGSTLQAWRSGQRHNDTSGQMPAIARQLSEADVAAVSAYYASLPWVSSASRVARPGAATPVPAARRTPRGPGGPAPAHQGVGTEQGAPLTGGAQGPGGGGATQQPAR